jgi:hypothetical protein
MERLEELADEDAIKPEDLELLAGVIRDQNKQLSDLREIKDGYMESMIAWRLLAQDGKPLEDSLKGRSNGQRRRILLH